MHRSRFRDVGHHAGRVQLADLRGWAARRKEMNWIDRKICMPPVGERILAFSPEYTDSHPMRFRVLDSQFYRISIESTHWATLEAPSEETP